MEVIKDGERIANVSAPGSVFGDQAVLLDQPHTADVRTLEQSEFYVADAQAMLKRLVAESRHLDVRKAAQVQLGLIAKSTKA